MRAVFALVLLLGIGLAGGAVYMAMGYIEDNEARLARAEAARRAMVQTVEVYAAAKPLAYGETITADDVQLVRYAEDFLPEGAFRTMEELFPDGEDELRVVLRPMEENEVLLEVKVTAPGEEAGLNQVLSPGMRAFAIRVDATSGVSGFLRPGDFVDVYWSGRYGNAFDGQEFTRLIDTNVKIIAVDQSADGLGAQARIARTVTVEVSPNQVAALAQAQSSGKLTLSLVGWGDETTAGAIEIDTQTLLGIEAPEEVVEVEEAPEQVCTVRTRRGAEIIEVPIPCRGG